MGAGGNSNAAADSLPSADASGLPAISGGLPSIGGGAGRPGFTGLGGVFGRAGGFDVDQ